MTDDRSLHAAVDAAVSRALEEKRLVGAVVAVARGGEVVLRKAYGQADREAGRQMHESTVFRLASLTKAVTSAIVLALVERGTLQLSDPVSRWIPEFTPALADGRRPAITLQHLLTHTSGLGYSFNEPEGKGPYHDLGISDGLDHPGITLQENILRLSRAPLLFEPGTAWQYSLGFDVAAEVAMRATGKSYSSLTRELITGPLGMDETEYWALHPDRLAVPYADGSPEPVRMQDAHHIVPFHGAECVFSPSRALDPKAYPSGGAGLVGTADDFLKFLEALRTGGKPILKSESVKTMTSHHIGALAVAARGPGWGFGLGVAILQDAAQAGVPGQIGTYGWGGAYGHSWWVDPASQLSVLALTNTAFEGMAGQFPGQLRAAIYSA